MELAADGEMHAHDVEIVLEGDDAIEAGRILAAGGRVTGLTLHGQTTTARGSVSEIVVTKAAPPADPSGYRPPSEIVITKTEQSMTTKSRRRS